MNKSSYLNLCVLICSAGLLCSSCLKTKPVIARTFVLSPTTTAASSNVTTSVEVAVKMPSYLQRSAMAVRKDGNEIVYLETAQWADRLDQLLRQTLTQDLSVMLSTHPPQQGVRVALDVQRFDVDTQGRGTLLATWRIIRTSDLKLLKSGEAHFSITGRAADKDPQAIAETMSTLVTRLSEQLARVIPEVVRGK
jgi:uncharacterized protein